MRITSVLAALCLCMPAALVTGCGSKAEISSVVLALTPGGFDENSASAGLKTDNLVVLRCSEYSTNAGKLAIKTSKSMSVTALYLAFVELQETPAGQYAVPIAIAPITGKEYEYDLSRAAWYLVSRQEASDAASLYGINYPDWEYGAVNGSEKFPCCQ